MPFQNKNILLALKRRLYCLKQFDERNNWIKETRWGYGNTSELGVLAHFSFITSHLEFFLHILFQSLESSVHVVSINEILV